VVEAFTGELPPAGSHTAESSYASGLVDALLPGDEVVAWIDRALQGLTPEPAPIAATSALEAPSRSGREQVLRARARTSGGAQLLADLLTDGTPLRARRGDGTVAATVGRLAGRPVVGVAVAAEVGGRPTPDGYRLAARAYRLADRLGLPVVSLVDTPGADPGAASEEDGIAGAMGEALDALLACRTPTIALVHGEGGSGGALAAAATDAVLVTEDAYFAAIGPEGAAAALRRPAEECADLMRITPADLLALGVADAMGGTGDVAAQLGRLGEMPDSDRLARRWERWRRPVTGKL
jgi:acetyl-CoA carboxylase carboxyl transferase subunit beta